MKISKIIPIAIALIMFVYCKNDNTSVLNRENKIKKHQSIIKPKVWEEYKRNPVGSIEDESAYKDCFFKIIDENFYYYRNGTLMYVDTFLHDSVLNRTIFRNHYSDEIIFSKDSTYVTLKRYNYGGEYEYFSKGQ